MSVDGFRELATELRVQRILLGLVASMHTARHLDIIEKASLRGPRAVLAAVDRMAANVSRARDAHDLLEEAQRRLAEDRAALWRITAAARAGEPSVEKALLQRITSAVHRDEP